MQNPDSVCFVGKVEQIKPIEGAEKVVQSIISGWECVIQKDKYKVGDLVVIATTDAVIPFELAESLGVTSYLKNRKKTGQYTVKTTKLRGVYSTAMIVTGDVFLPEGEDMMKDFGIFKYEEPTVEMTNSVGKKVKYQKNPNFHVYYKFPNAKNAPNLFSTEDEVVITNKIHGCNARYAIVKKNKITIIDRIKKLLYKFIKHTPISWKYSDYDYVYGSHTVEKGSQSQHFYSSDVWKQIADKYKIREKLWSFVEDQRGGLELGEGIIVYGEIYGPGIQKYYDYGLKETEFKVFDFKLNGEYVNHDDFCYLASGFRFDICPILYQGKFNEEIINSLQNNRFIPNTKVPEEGIVVKSITGDRSKICKYINPAYLEFQSKKEDSTDFH